MFGRTRHVKGLMMLQKGKPIGELNGLISLGNMSHENVDFQ